MVSNVKIVAGAVALAIAGSASAASFTPTDLYANVVDYSVNSSGIESSTSYLVDLGVTEASFNGSQSYSFNLNNDTANFTSPFTGTGSSIVYSVVGGNGNGSGPTKYSIDTTTNIDPGSFAAVASKSGEQTALSALQAIIPATGTGFSSGTYSSISTVLASGSGWGGSPEATWSNNALNSGIVPYGDNAAIGSTLNFFNESGNGASAVTQFAGTWDLVGGILTYTPTTTAVPLPTPLLLLLSGLGLMGVVARRGKSAVGGGLAS
jgi:hypothetical protein